MLRLATANMCSCIHLYVCKIYVYVSLSGSSCSTSLRPAYRAQSIRAAVTEHRDGGQRGVCQYQLEVKQDARQTPSQHENPGQDHRRRSARHEPVDYLHVRGGRDKTSSERRTDATSGDPKHERLAGCCYRAHPATQHVYHRVSIHDSLYRWSHPVLGPSDSTQTVLCSWGSSRCTNICVHFV